MIFCPARWALNSTATPYGKSLGPNPGHGIKRKGATRMEDLIRRNSNVEIVVSKLAEQYQILNPATAALTLQTSTANLGANHAIDEKSLDRIQLAPGGITNFQIPGLDGDEIVKHVTGFIEAWRFARIYHEKAYGEGGSKIPSCKSLDGLWGIGNPGGDCTECPRAQYGSDPRGGRGQACKQIRQILFLREGHIVPYLLNVPPTSLKNAQQYFLRLTSVNVPYWAIVTNLSLESVQNQDGVKYARIIFSAGPRLNAAERELMEPFAAQMSAMLRPIDITTADYEEVGQEGEQPDTAQE